ncbi:alpha/beta fold hydrolase [Aeromicrobium sp. NPDC092404]|uniref:alpha/beta hydrolase n=1 Tax=Aeromicrobium sp. NPDC092404 TaxID=3154976 RepID=UPI0034409127
MTETKPNDSLVMAEMRLNLFPDAWVDFQVSRFLGYAVHGAATLGEVLTLASQIDQADLETWHVAWRQMSQRCADAAAELTGPDARSAHLRSMNYAHASEQFLPQKDARRREIREHVKASFGAAMAATGQAAEYLEYESRGVRLPAWYLPCPTADDAPTLMLLGGGDSCVEELGLIAGLAALERGYNVFLFEVPGQGSSLAMNEVSHFAPDSERDVSAAVDLVLQQPGVDGDRLALAAFSLGGYLGPRAAAFEPRVKAWVFDAALQDLRHLATSVAGIDQMLAAGKTMDDVDAHMEALRGVPPVAFGFDWFSARFAPATRWSQMIEHLEQFVIADDVLARIEAPVAVIVGESEPPAWYALSRHLVELLGERATLDVLPKGGGADDHVSVANFPALYAVMFKRLNDMLA